MAMRPLVGISAYALHGTQMLLNRIQRRARTRRARHDRTLLGLRVREIIATSTLETHFETLAAPTLFFGLDHDVFLLSY